MLKVTYNPKYGIAIEDGLAELTVNDWVDHRQMEITVSSHLLIDWLRVAIKKKRIPVGEVEVYYDRDSNPANIQKMVITPEGSFMDWPEGFCDHTTKALQMLLE